ncbi:MAG TPA: hypothetical protein VE010_08520 [Thermoanaerobaculia bacterium]|nr:hypothetical protein [Thermoanaerobaculia bacterium]
MKASKLFYTLIAVIALIHAAAASAGTSIDAVDDPRRAVGREDDVRIDAILLQETVTPGAPIGIAYQVQNFSSSPVAIAYRESSASYEEDSRTMTLSLGAEVPPDGKMPQLVLIAPGHKRIFKTGVPAAFKLATLRNRASSGLVQVKVTVLRNLEPFAALIAQQTPEQRTGATLTDAQFERWFESNDTILLNTVPVRFSGRSQAASLGGADRRASRRY